MIEIKNLSKSFETAQGTVEALKDVSITVNDGDVYGIIGMSGAGKSTLVRTVNMLERPSGGQVIIDGVDIGKLNKKELRKARREITMIFQGFNLLMQRNCLKNVCFPSELSGMKKKEAEEKAMELLDTVGLKDKAKAYPAQLSGGQQQRVAIARALATNPKVLLCDEATSALDPTTTNQILDLIRDINKKTGITVIVITHQMSVVESICNKVAILDGGRVVETGLVSEVFSHPESVAAKKLVYPDGEEEQILLPDIDQSFIRVVFNGAKTAATPTIARMAIEIGVEANIAYASTKSIGGKAYGSMILSVDKDKLNSAVQYLTATKDVLVSEVNRDEC